MTHYWFWIQPLTWVISKPWRTMAGRQNFFSQSCNYYQSYLSSGIPVKYSANVRKQLHAPREDASRCRNHDRMERTHTSLPSAHKAPAMFHLNDGSAALLVPEDDTLAHLKSAEQELVLRVVCLVPKRGHHWLFQRSEKTPCIMQRQKNLHTRKIDLHTSTLRNCLC